jgi:hypothetical protein
MASTCPIPSTPPSTLTHRPNLNLEIPNPSNRTYLISSPKVILQPQFFFFLVTSLELSDIRSLGTPPNPDAPTLKQDVEGILFYFFITVKS